MGRVTIYGYNLNIDDLIEKTKLRGYSKHYKGIRVGKKRILPYSYISKKIALYNEDLDIEIKNIMHYLNRHKQQFLLIKGIKEVDFITLDMDSTSKKEVEEDYIFWHEIFFPANFIKLCAELGISIEYRHDVEINM